MNTALPATLITATPADGHALAQRLAVAASNSAPVPATMPEMLRPADARPSVVMLAAVYFQAIASANCGWNLRQV